MYSFHALEVLPVARNAKFQPMYPLLEGVTVPWFWHSNKVLPVPQIYKNYEQFSS